MTIFSKIGSLFKSKAIGIMDLGGRLFGSSWSTGKYLEVYEKSLYVYACVTKIARKVGSNRFRLFQIVNSKGDTKELLNHPVLDLIYRVNPFQTKEEFLETLVINRLLAGNAFIFKVRNDRGQVVELWNLRPDRVTILKDPVNFIAGYKFQKEDGSSVTFTPADIIHIKDSSPLDQYLGTSPLKPAAVRVDVEEYATTYQRDFFLNNARPDAVLEVEGNLLGDQKAEITEGWEARHKRSGGISNNSKISVLEGGIKYNQISLSQREMDYIESLKFTRDDILVAFGVPKPIVGVTDDVNRANAEAAMFVFLSETVKPELERITTKLNEELVYLDFGDNLFLEYTDPTPDDREFKLREIQALVGANVMLLNEARATYNLPPMVGGNSFYLPLGVSPVGGLSNAEKMLAEKQRVFVGKPFLKMKLELAENITASVTKAVKDAKKAGKRKAEEVKVPVKRSLLTDPEMKQKYFELINKRIDKRASTFKEALLKAMKEQAQRVQDKLNDLVDKGLKRKVRASDVFNVKKENRLLSELALPFITEYARNAGEEAMALVAPAEQFELSEALLKTLKERADFFAENVNNTTLASLKDTIAEGVREGEGIREIADRVQGVYSEFSDYRADMIARTETTAANNEATLESWKQSNVANGKEWIATADDRTRDSHLDVNGEIVGLKDNFSNGLNAPGDMSADPGETVNCRCVIGPAFVE